MALTYFAAMPFVRDDDGNPVVGEAKEAQSSGQAIRFAQTMAAAEGACGAVAFSRTGDPATGDWADAVTVKAIGEVGELNP